MSQTMAIHSTWAKEEQENIIYFIGDVKNSESTITLISSLPRGMNVIELEGVDDKRFSWEKKEMAVFKHLIAHYTWNKQTGIL